MRRQLLLFTAALGTLAAALVYLGPLRYLRTGDVERAYQARINSSTRVLAYPINSERSLVLALRPDDTELRLLTNLVFPHESTASDTPGPTSDTRRDEHAHAYGLLCRFYDPSGRLIWEGEYWEQTSKTSITDPGQLLPLEEVFLDSRTESVSDTRVTHVMLGHLVTTGARRVEVSLVDARATSQSVPAARILVRALRLTHLGEREALRRWSRLDDAARESLLRQLTAYGADLVPDTERRAAMHRRWEIIPAEARAGEDHPSEEVYLTGLWKTYTPVLGELRHTELAGPHRALSVNVVGPCNLWIELGRQPRDAATAIPLGPDLAPGEAPLYRLQGLREDGVFVSGTRRLETSAGGHGLVAVHVPVPPGPATLLLDPLNFRCQARFYTDVANTLDGVEVARVVGPIGAEGRYLELQPDLALTRLFDARRDADDDPYVVAEVVHERGEQETQVRLGARLPVPPERFDESATLRLTVDLLDGGGRLLEQRTLEAEAHPSELALAWGEGDAAQLVTTLTTFRLRCRREVRTLRVHARESVLVGFYTRLRRLEDVLHVPEDYPASPEVESSRIARGQLKPPTWYYFRPKNAFELSSLGRESRVREQRRLFRPRSRANAEQRVSNFARTLHPCSGEDGSPHRTVRILEPARDEGERTLLARGNARWEVHDVHEQPVRLRDAVLPDSPRSLPLELLAIIPDAHADEMLLMAWVDGALRLETTVARGAQALDLGAYAPGTHLLRLELYGRSPGEDAYRLVEAKDLGARLFVNHTVLDPNGEPDTGRLHHERTCHVLTPGSAMRYDLTKGSNAPTRITCTVLAPPAGTDPDPRDLLDVHITRRLPDGTEVPQSERLVSVLRSAEPVTACLDGQHRGNVRRFFLVLGGDLPAGSYRLRLSSRSAHPLLVRTVGVDPTPARIGLGRFAHFDLRGPTNLRVTVSGEALARRGTSQVRLVHRLQGTDREAPLAPLVLERSAATDGDAVTVLTVPPGLHTVSIGALGAPIPARFHIDRPLVSLPGVEVLRISPEVTELSWLEVLPSHNRTSWFTLSPDAPLRFGLRGDRSLSAGGPALYAVRARVDMEAGNASHPRSVTLDVGFLDAGGEELSRDRTVLELLPDDAATVLHRPDRYPSQAGSAHVAPPADTVTMEIRAVTDTALVRVERIDAPDRARYVHAPFDARGPAGLRADHAARLPVRTQEVPPRHQQALISSGRAVTIESASPRVQVVVEPTTAAAAYGPATIDGVDAYVPVLEEAGPVDVAAWSPWLLAPIDRTTEATVYVASGPPGTPHDGTLTVLFDLGAAPTGDPVEVILNGTRAAVTLPVSQRGELRVQALPPGAHRLSLRGIPEGGWAFANRPTSEVGMIDARRHRTLHRLVAGADAQVRLDKPSVGDVVLVGTLYLQQPAAGDAPALHVSIEPRRRRSGVLLHERTSLRRTVVLLGGDPRPLLDMSRQEVVTWYAHPFAVPLKQDLPSGTYTVRMALIGAHAAYLHAGISHPGAPVIERVRRRVLRVEDAR
jgi:hypothetical protein